MKKAALFLLFFGGLSANSLRADPLSDDAFAHVVARGAKVEVLATGFQFVEGPAWNRRGFWVFSDIAANTLFKLSPQGKSEILRRPTGHSNGNAYDAQNRLVSCEGDRRVSRKSPRGTFDTLADRYEGKRLNSPNDLAIKSDGSIYFTDPTYGTPKNQLELDFRGLYRLFPDGRLQLLDKEWIQPNGLAFSPDERTLYVGDSSENTIFRFDVAKSGALSNKTLLATLPKPGAPDGLKTDAAGRLYVAGPGGAWIFAPRGGLLGKIPTPKNPANLAFGGADGKTLMITARGSIYTVRLSSGGAEKRRSGGVGANKTPSPLR